MRKRPITRQRLSGYPHHSCLHTLRSLRANHIPGKEFFRLTLAWLREGIWGFSVLLCAVSLNGFADEPNPPPPAFTIFGGFEESNSNELLQAILKLQEKVTARELVLQENLREARELAARNAEAITNGLQRIEREFSEQQQSFLARSTSEVDAMQSTNRNLLLVVIAFAATGFLAMLITACFQWRVSNAWARISNAMPVAFGPGRHSAIAAVGAAGHPLAPSPPIEDSSLRLFAAMERIERCIEDLERSSKPGLALQDPTHLQAHASKAGQALMSDHADAAAHLGATTDDARISMLLNQGQSKCKENDLEAALECFDEVLSLNPNQSEALVRKGATLERLKKLNEAFECYDRAIAANDSMTIAYLHKGGLCNRLERFKEALECYEKALRTQEGWGGLKS